MSNFLPDQTVASIKDLAAKGFALRAIARAVGISANTVGRYIPDQSVRKEACPCGKQAGHNGWCKDRYSASQSRQAFHAARRGDVIELSPAIKLSRIRERRRKYDRWLNGPIEPVSFAAMFGIIGQAKHACRTFPRDVREDIVSELTVRALEGRIFRDEIPLAAKWFLGRALRHHYATVSFDASILDGGPDRWSRFRAADAA